MAVAIIHGQKSGVQSVDNVKAGPDGNVDLKALKTTGGNMTGNIAMGDNAVTGVKDATAPTDATNLKTVQKEAKEIVNQSWDSKVVDVLNSAWDSKSEQTVTVNGVTATNDIIVTPAPASYDKYYESSVRVIKQAKNSVTFKFTEGKPDDLKVNILIKKVLA